MKDETELHWLNTSVAFARKGTPRTPRKIGFAHLRRQEDESAGINSRSEKCVHRRNILLFAEDNRRYLKIEQKEFIHIWFQPIVHNLNGEWT